MRGPDQLTALLNSVRRSGLHDAAAKALLHPRPASPPISLDLDKLADAQRLFAIYQTEILGALLLVALPQSSRPSSGRVCLAPAQSSSATSYAGFAVLPNSCSS